VIRVVSADDHRVVRVGLEQLLQTFDDVEFLGAGGGGEEAVALCAEHRPDVLLLDLSMPDVDGIEVTKRLRDASPDTRRRSRPGRPPPCSPTAGSVRPR
jgi:DNA-binding NarL/FixJ family response regulator